MKNTVSPAPKSVSEKTEKLTIEPVRVSDMGLGMRMRASKEAEKKQPTAASV